MMAQTEAPMGIDPTQGDDPEQLCERCSGETVYRADAVTEDVAEVGAWVCIGCDHIPEHCTCAYVGAVLSDLWPDGDDPL
jgi:hypothetical protein